MICKKYGTYCTEIDCYYCRYCVHISERGTTFDSMCGYNEETEKNREAEMEKLLGRSMDTFDLSVRAMNCLKYAGISKIGDLIKYNPQELLRFRTFGKKTIYELNDLISYYGLKWKG